MQTMQLDLLAYRAPSGDVTAPKPVGRTLGFSPAPATTASLNNQDQAHNDDRAEHGVHFGLLGWQEPELNIWDKYLEEGLRQHRLSDYLAHPMYSVACLGPGMEPLRSPVLSRYAAQLGPGHQAVLFAHPSVTSPRYREGRGYVCRGGQVNPNFMNSRYFLREILEPAERALKDQLRFVLLSFPDYLASAGLKAEAFAERLDRFLAQIPKRIAIAVEIRDPRLLCASYGKVLARHDASHVFTDAQDMPSLVEQRAKVPPAPYLIFKLGQQALEQETVDAICAHDRVTPSPTFVLADPRHQEGLGNGQGQLEQGLQELAHAMSARK